MSAHLQDGNLSLEQYDQLLADIDRARREWVLAQEQLNYILDPDLIDHAIYLLDAAEKKYGFLLREARKYGVKVRPVGA